MGTCPQTLPFQCSIRDLMPGPSVPSWPTAQALRAEVAATRPKKLAGPGLGLGTRVHALPFQCSIRVLVPGPGLLAGPPVPVRPTAQALQGDVAATPTW